MRYKYPSNIVVCLRVDITVRDNEVVTPTLAHKESSSKLTPRQQTIFELYGTEKNYVSILQTILQVCDCANLSFIRKKYINWGSLTSSVTWITCWGRVVVVLRRRQEQE